VGGPLYEEHMETYLYGQSSSGILFEVFIRSCIDHPRLTTVFLFVSERR
jgi:hypothetical protein